MTFHNERPNSRGAQVYVLKHHVVIKRREFDRQSQAVVGKESKEFLRVIEGDCEIEIGVQDLINLCNKAALNRTHQARVGPINVKFRGIDQRTEVPR